MGCCPYPMLAPPALAEPQPDPLGAPAWGSRAQAADPAARSSIPEHLLQADTGTQAVPGMRSLMDAEAHLVPEAALAFWTCVGGGSRVSLLVLEQVLLLTEASCALWAAEGPLASVVALMALQVRLLAEALATLAAEVRLLARVCALVDFQG